MAQYGDFARGYAAFSKENKPEKWVNAIKKHLSALNIEPLRLLDIPCGTGNMMLPFLREGIEVVGADISEEMLAQCQMALSEEGFYPQLFQMTMERFKLPGSFDAVICCTDSVNYLTNANKVRSFFARVSSCLRPGGAFIFDVNTPKKFELIMDGTSSVYEDENGDDFLCWSGRYNRKTGVSHLDITCFEKNSAGSYTRYDERHTQRAYRREQLEQLLEDEGFVLVGVYDGFSRKKAGEDTLREFYATRKSNK